MSIRPAQDTSEVQAAYELAARVFGPNYFEAREAKHRLLTDVEPIDSPAEVVVATDHGAVIGLIRLVSRRLRFGPDVFKVAGITSVAVASSHRGRGIGVGLMRVALREARRRGDDLSVVFARRAVDGWYPKFGFLGIGQHVEFRVPATETVKLGGSRGDLFQVRSGFDAAALGAYRSAYVAAYSALPGSFIRSRDWWKRLGPRLSMRPSAEFLTLTSSDDRTVGYALVEGDRISEVATATRDAAAASTMLIAELRKRGHPIPVFVLHPLHPVIKALYPRNHTLSVRRAWDGGHMASALDPSAAARLSSYGIGVGQQPGQVDDLRIWPVWSPLDEF